MACVKFFKDNNKFLTIIAFAVLFALKMSFDAYPFLDDYIQFKGYSLYNNPLKDTYINMGLFSTRPLAGLLDIMFYSKFYNNLYMPYFLITLMHFFAIALMQFNFKSIGIHLGWCFVILSLFNPVLIEATYWISASSRIIPPLFLSQLAIYFMCKSCEKPAFLNVFAFFLLNLSSLGFYEQISLFSFFATLFFCIMLKRRTELLISIFNMGLFAIYYFIFKNNGIYFERSTIGDVNFMLLLKNINVALNASLKTIFTSINFTTPAFKTIVAVILCLPCIKPKITPFCPQKLYIGFALLVICFLPFILLENYFITFRGLFIAILGVAIIIDATADIWKIKYSLTVLILILMLLGWTNEMQDYKKAYAADRKIINGISRFLAESQTQSNNFTLGILGAKKCYVPIKVLYGEHILNITSSDWALTGALRAEFENVKFKYVIITDDKYNNLCNMILDVSDINNIKKLK